MIRVAGHILRRDHGAAGDEESKRHCPNQHNTDIVVHILDES